MWKHHPRSPAAVARLAAAGLVAASMLSAGAVHGAPPEVTDGAITARVEKEIHQDPAVPLDPIDVDTEQGIVSLSGSVRSLLVKERAARIARTVRGVRSVVNGIGVSPAPERKAGDLAREVREALRYDPATDAGPVEVSATDQGEVTLRGTADSWQEKRLAGRIATGVSGVTGVTNELTVVADASRSDPEIAREVQARLAWDVLIDHDLIEVDVAGARVTLQGVVGSAAEKERAAAAAQVHGVASVDPSALRVERWARDEDLRGDKYVQRPDPRVAEAVRDALGYDPRVDLSQVEVEVRDGVAFLRGVVTNRASRRAAARDARNTVGVLGVTNLLKVRPETAPAEEAVAESIADALARNPFTEAYEIDVQVDDQVATLEGRVDSYFEKAEAENAALGAAGIVRVRNNLRVNRSAPLTFNPYVAEWSIHDYPWYAGGVAPPGAESDAAITRAIQDELFWSPFVDGEDVRVVVDDGVARLSGTVGSWGEYRSARENAFEGGARAVAMDVEVQ